MSELKLTWGGFIADNIRNWIIKECRESGDPLNFFMAIYDVVDELSDDGADGLDFWNTPAEVEEE